MNRLELPTILIADDDDGHAFLIEENLRRAGVNTEYLRCSDGEEVLDFLSRKSGTPQFDPARSYLLLLDIRMPKRDGISVLQEIKSDPLLRRLPVLMLTTTDDPREVDRCHELGCNVYVRKPISFESFAAAIAQLGRFVGMLELPRLSRAA